MAARIRNEQGRERAGEYLAAMEPFLAPGERAHIAAQLGVPMVQRAPQPPPAPSFEPPPSAGLPPIFSQMTQQRGGMGDMMQMMQMLQAFGGMGGKGKDAGNMGNMGGMNNPLMLAQMLGLMGKK